MFGLSQKEKAEDAIKRGALAATIGGYFHHSDAERFGLNEEATAYLYTDAMAHQIYALGFISSKALRGKSWATPEFFFGAVVRGIFDGEDKNGLTEDFVFEVLMKRFWEFEKMPQAEAADGGRFKDTAKGVKNRDENADLVAIEEALAGC